MNHLPNSAPEADEYAPFYAGYVATVAGMDLTELLAQQPDTLRALCGSLSDEEALYRYAPGKWSIKQVLGHLSDAERVFSYRVLRISRGDATPLPGFSETRYVDAAGFDERTVTDLLDEFESVRAASLALLGGLRPEQLLHKGTASNTPVTVRALVYILAGHPQHHMNILRERYGLAESVAP